MNKNMLKLLLAALASSRMVANCGALGQNTAQNMAPNTTPKTWTLTSGAETFRLIERGHVLSVDYFGPTSKLPAVATGLEEAIQKELLGQADGEPLSGSEMSLISANPSQSAAGVQTITLTLRHNRLPLDIVERYSAWADTGVFTREVTLRNTGRSAVSVASALSLALTLPKGDYTMRNLYGSWSEEHQLASQSLLGSGWTYSSTRGRSTNGFAPWVSVRNEGLKTEYLAELAWSGNWDVNVARQEAEGVVVFSNRPSREETLRISMGAHWDFGGALNLPAGASYELPKAAFTASTGDLDDVTNQMHRYQRRFVFPHVATNDPLLVQFNSWYPFPAMSRSTT